MRMERKDKKVLFKQGAYVRRAMQRSMRYAGKSQKPRTSKPGEPPRAHKDNPKGPMLRKLVAFEVDLNAKSVVTGPQRFGAGTVPKSLNEGGTIQTRPAQMKSKLGIDDYGPIRRSSTSVQSRRIAGPGSDKYVRIKLKTGAQVDRAISLADQYNASLPKSVTVHIAARPFTLPLLSDGGANLLKLIKDTPL